MVERPDTGAPAEADQALVDEARSGLHPSGFDPSRIVDPVERAEAWHLHLYQMLDAEREHRRQLEDALDILLPIGGKFAAAVSHYNGGAPRYPGSQFTLDPEPSCRPALTTSCNGPIKGAPLNGPTIGDLRMFAEAYAIAMEARQGGDAQQAPSRSDDSAGRQASPKGGH